MAVRLAGVPALWFQYICPADRKTARFLRNSLEILLYCTLRNSGRDMARCFGNNEQSPESVQKLLGDYNKNVLYEPIEIFRSCTIM